MCWDLFISYFLFRLGQAPSIKINETKEGKYQFNQLKSFVCFSSFELSLSLGAKKLRQLALKKSNSQSEVFKWFRRGGLIFLF